MKLKNYLLTIMFFFINITAFFKQKVKSYKLPYVHLFLFVILMSTTTHAQTFKTFTIRYNTELKGDMLSIGNNILGKDNNALNDNTLLNENVSMQYIDIDSDASTFSSSSANLSVPSTVSCFKIAFAGLYWGALIKTGDSRTDIEKIKLKLPGNSTYTDITGEIIYDANVAPIVPDSNKPYACYANVTSLLSGLTSPQGTYTAANIKSSIGSNGTTGLAAGWTLFVIYEDPSTTSKYMVAYDGFAALYDGRTLDIPISGFQTPASGTINLKYAFAALNGDKNASKSKVEISNGTSNGSALTTTQRPSNDFFNAAITNLNSYATSRTPNGTNSLGYDTGIEEIQNVNKSTIGNNATSAQITLQVARGQANPVFSFFNAILINVIAPDIELTKLVKDISGNDIGNTDVTLGTNLYYEIGFQNIGNDNVTKFTIKDILPKNVTFNYPSDITSLPTGVTHTYNATTRTLIFTVPDDLVNVGDVKQTIRLHVQVVSDYNQLTDACDNEIKNQALATYQGVINTKQIVDEGSYPSLNCNYGTPQSTNFLVNIDGHTFTKTSVLCGASTTLSAADGYTSYSWSTSPTGTPVVGTNQTYTVTNTGTYYVTSTSSCRTIKEIITVIPFGNTITNPVIPYADEVVTCQNNGKALPNIFLCGANASRLIQTSISDASSIEWEKLNESSCAAQTIANCANENTACQWNVVSTGANFTVNSAGQYRVTLKYSGGCFSRFYFNVYQNLLNPTYTTKDIVCTTNGKITIGGVPAGYEYSLDNVNYQSSNIFTITTAGSYTVYIKQVGVTTNPCIFSVPNILIRKRNFSGTTIVTQPLCNGDKGSIKIAAVDADPQYYYSISQGATLINSVGPVTASDYEFANLNSGTYTVRVWTDDGCDYSATIQITNPPLLSATSALTKPLTCKDGEITVYPVGGTAPYAYYVNGSTSSQSTPQIVVSNPLPSGGVYSIEVVDSKNCKATTSITVAAIAPPVYTVSQTDILCYNDTTGEIKFNVSNANGYTLAYSIDNGVTYTSNPSFSNLSAGTYNAILKYSLAGTDCFSSAQTITITQPSTALTASAGVSELAGCGPNGEGKIRITNPQGGTPFPSPNFYLYSFDNQITWTTVNEAYKMPGTYTVYIKDANGCIYPMSVTIDAIPSAPTIAVDSSSFNCDGTATSTVTVTNNGSSNYSYQYLIDGTLNPNTADPKVFLNVASGSHTISVKYQLMSVSTYSNLLNEDFGTGTDTTSPGINSAFCFEKQNFLTCDKNGTLNNGEYTVTNTIKNGIYSGWHNPVDHTTGSASGRYLAVDAGIAIPNNAVLYRKSINDIIPNQPIQVRFFATNLLKVGNTQPDASLTVEVQNSAGTALSSQSTGGIPKTNGWVEYNLTINPGNNSSLDFVLRLEVAQVNGIDFAVDDIQVYQLPKSCIIQKDFAVVIPTNQAFDASVTGFKNISCAGTNDGTITIAAQNFNTTKGFQYSVNGGTSWITQMTSPYTITGLTAGTYNLQIRYDAASTGTCVKSFTQILTEPTALVTNATVSILATCSSGATINANSTGGTVAYRYELWDAAGTTNIRPSQNSGVFSNVGIGSYIVRGYDANNCWDDSATITIVAPPTLTALLDPSSDLCYDSINQASLTINVSGGTSPYVYSLDGAPSQNSNTFANVGTGPHSILVTDSFGCIAPALSVTITPQLTINAVLTKDLDCTSSPNAVISGTVAGGYTPFNYQIKVNGGSYSAATAISGNNFSYSTTTAGTYQFQITDAKGCISESGIITINPVVNPTATTTVTNVSCNGLSDGSVIIIPSSGVAPYTYSFNGSTFSSTTTYSGLAAGTYSYIVKDSKDCTFNGSVSIIQPTVLTTTATATTFSCSVTNTKQAATVTIALPTTGTAPYQYSFNGSGFSATNTLILNDNGTDQTIPYAVKDANGCIYSSTITVLKLNPPTTGTITNSAITCNANATTSTVTVTPVTGTGVGTLTYEITFPASAATSNTTGIFNNLSPDTYIFKVTDVNGCYYTQSITVAPVTHITITGNKTSDVLCNGGNTGSIQYTVSGFSGTYSYIFNGQTAVTGQTSTSIIKNGLAAGTYLITVTDEATGCTANASITITQPPVLVASSATATHVNCNNDNSQITVTTASGGTQNYTYAAVISGTTAPTTYSNSNIITVDTNSATNLIWDVYVKDANGCIATTTVTLINDALPTINTPAIQCYVGSPINISITGTSVGVPTYSIGSGFQSSPNFTINAAGTYILSLKDASGCIATTTYTVYPQLTALPLITKELDCTATPAATITVTAAGGKSPYSYAVSTDGGSTYTAMGTNVYSTLVAGTFQFRVTDANNCITNASTTINPLIPITTTTTNVDPSCNGTSDGSVQIIPSGGVAPYTYSFDGSPFTATSLYSNLKAGIAYAYEVRDSKNCPFTATVTLTEPVTLTATESVTPFSCSATNTKQAATITVTATSGTGTAPYQYSFNGSAYSAVNTLTLNDNGLDQPYTYSVRDAKGCIVSGGGTLLKLNPPTDLSFTAAPITCLATTTTVTASATNGVGTLTYEIVFPGASATLNTTGVFAGLAPGTYIFKVTDANGCYYTESHIVNPVTPIAIAGNKTSDVLCNGGNTGAAAFTVSGFSSTGNYTIAVTTVPAGLPYTQSQSGDVISLTNLVAGIYKVKVTDNATGCDASVSVEITEPTNALTFTATPTKVNCNNYNSQITITTASGGTKNYTYAAVISGAAAPTTYSNSDIITVDTNSGANLSWDVYLKDANGCIEITPVTVINDPLPTVSIPALASNQCSVSTGFNFTATGTGIAPLSYSINGGISYQSSPVFIVNLPGIYTVTIKDGNGCTATSLSPTIVSSPITTNAVLTKDLTCSSPTDATIDVTTNGGKLPYSYKVKIGAGSYGSSTAFVGAIFTYTASTADTYQFEITDANGCTKETNITTTTAVLPTASYTAVDPTCNGNSDGSIKLTALTGEGPFTYSINGGATFVATNVFGGLVAGGYPYIVRDNKGCEATGTITLNNPVLIIPNIVMYPIVCNANTPGSFDVSVTSGGVAPFTYNLYDSSYNLLDSYSEAGTSPTAVHNFGGLTFGDYYITIVDAKGCQFSSSKQRITTPPFLTLDAVTLGGNCIVGATVDLTVVTGGVAPYRYSIFGQPSTESAPTAATTYTFTGLLHGTSYFFQVKDNNNCISVLEVPIPTISSIGVVIDNKSNVTCNGANNGIINYTVSGFDATVTTIEYELLNPLTNSPITPAINGTITGVAGGPTSGSISGLKPGDYLLKVKESTGTLCSALIPFNITQPIQPLNATISNVTNANCNTGAQITVSATGGTGPYQYAFVQDGAPQAGAYNNSNLGVLNPFPLPLKLDWDIWVKDANGCEFKIDKTITVDPSPTINPVGLQCFTGSGLSITLTGTYVGTPTYSIGGAYQASPSFTINSPGTYNVSIKDSNGCIAATTYDVKPQVLLQADLTQDLTCAVDASITLTPSGGTGTYTTYEVSFNGGSYAPAISPYITNIAGSYIFRVTDSQGCPAISNEIIVTPNTTPTFTFTQTNVSCNGGSNGSIVITAANGIAPYQYSKDNGVTFQSSNVFTGLNAAGTYTVVIKDSKSCTSAPTSIIITEPTVVGGTATLTQGLTCGAGNATQAAHVTITGIGGTGLYLYSYDGGVNYTTSNTYTTNNSGLVTVYIKDTNGCISAVPATVNVPALNPPTDLNFVSPAITCSAPTTTVTVTVPAGQGGIAPFTYDNITSATSSGTGVFAGLLPGTYLFQVTDANGCTYQESYTVNPVTNITVSGQLISDVTCNETPAVTNGAVTFTVGNFAGTYSYTINGVATGTAQTTTTINLTGLGIGNQVIAVTDDVTGCTATTTITVAQPLVQLTLTQVSNINANCNSGAKVTVAASGGTPNYTYAFVANNATPLASDYTASPSAILPFTAPAPNHWDVWVKDLNGCTYKLDIATNVDALPTIVTPASQCFVGTPLTIDLLVGQTVPVGPVKYYTINGSNQTSPIYTITAPGTYKLSIVDANGCSSNVVDYIVQPQLLLNTALTKELDCTTSPDAIVTLTASGGTTPYTLYEYSTNAGTSYTAMGSNVLTTSTAGTYIFRVTDTQGCQAVSSGVTITPQTTPTFTFTQTNVSCNGGSNGSIVITAANGIAPYQYSKDNGVTFQSSNVFTGLNAAGTYTIVVKDSKSCASVTSPLTITEPTVVGGTATLTQRLTCGAGNATQAALVTVTGNGGTGFYTYSFNGGVNYTASNTYSTNVAGLVTAYIKDTNGCISAAQASVNVPALNPPTDLNFLSTAVTCVALTSNVTLTTTNGVGTLSYAILSPSSATSNVSGASSGIFTGLLPGTYLFQVTDANFCTYQESYTVNPVTNITVSGQLISDVTCNPGSTGAAKFTVANFTGTYSYALIAGTGVITQTGNILDVTNLGVGTYTMRITDNITGCTADATVVVNQPAVLDLTELSNVPANCNSGAKVSVSATGGTPNYVYAFVQNGLTPAASDYTNSASAVLDPTVNTQWDVYVKDVNGCTDQIDITITTDPLPSGITVPGLSQCPSATGTYTFTVNVTSGMAPFEYSIGAGFQTSPTFTVNAPGTYDVTVKDKNGCTTTVSGLVKILPALQLQATITALPTCVDGDGTLTVVATGGSGTYQYSLDAGVYQPSANFTAISSGSHTVTVRDITTTCTKSIPVNLGAATPITGFALSKTDVTCNGGNDGVITATMATPALGINDNPVYNYSLSGTIIRPAQTSNIFSGLPAGNYTVTVTSARGCTDSKPIIVSEPALITVPAPAVAGFDCNSGSNAMNFASITVTGVTGGSGTYSNYEFIKNGSRAYFGPNNIYQEADLSGGSYVINVFDNKGCIGTTTTPITIAPYITLDKINVTVNNAITCNNLENITVTVSSIGGTPTNLQYTLVDKNATTGVMGAVYPSQINTTGVFTGLPVADYLITVKNLDTNCEIQGIHYVYEPNTFDLSIDTIVDVTCFGGTNGRANVTIVDKTITATNPNQAGAFSYTVTGPVGSSGSSATAGPLTLNNLAAGTYTITATLTNSPFCQVSKAFTINQPTAALKISETHTQITCIPGNDGTISATATGGWPGGYQFELSGPVNVTYSTQSNFTNLSAGLYTIRVKDSKGCVDQIQVTLANPTPIAATATPSTTLLSCFGDKNATITITNVTGGQGSNYSYILNTVLPSPTSSGPQLSPIFSGLGAGTYTITVKDGYNCSFTSTNIVITEPTVVKANLVVASTQTCQTQTRLTLTASGGTAPYSCSDTANFTTSTGMTGNSTTFSVPAGTYRYYVRDANGCTSVVSNNIKIDPLPSLVIILDKTNAFINCKGDNSGDIVATAQGGLGNYVYSLLDGSGNPVTPTPTQLSPGNFTGLFAGNYMVRVTSGDCTTTSALISITEPTAPLAAPYTTKNVSCNGAKNGEIVINATGGTGMIQYAISPNLNQFYNTNSFTNLAPGNYDVIVQDKLGCYIKINFTITEPNLLSASTVPLSIIPEICSGDKDGAFSITIAGGTAPYSVSLDNINGTYTTGTLTQTDFDFTGLTGGNHVAYIRDAAGCTTDWSVPLPESINMSPVAVVTYDCVNNAASNLITVTVDSSITNPADVDYSLDGGTYQAGNTFTNVPAGTHFVRTRHTNGCEQQTANFNVAQIDPLTLILSDGGLNEIVATATGGGGNYQYTLNGESYGDTHNFIIYKSGNYTVTVTDTNGCVASATRYFEYIDVCIPNHFTPNGDGVQDGWAPGCTINYKDLTFDIFDRYGRKVASYRLGQYWDGKYNGSELPTGDYWYVIKLNDPKDNREFVGHFTLYR
jgi:gliding motility-associated-like protein